MPNDKSHNTNIAVYSPLRGCVFFRSKITPLNGFRSLGLFIVKLSSASAIDLSDTLRFLIPSHLNCRRFSVCLVAEKKGVFSESKMSRAAVEVPPKGGFSFDLRRRNEMLSKKGVPPPSFRKTGTTIVGVIFQDGVILGADTRATEGPIVCDKNCEKIHYMAPNIYCCGAGTAADTEAVTDTVSSQLQLHRYHTGRESRVIAALTLLKSHLFKYQGYVQAALVLGGVDVTGPHLHTIYPHGSTDTLPFATMGSGSLAAMAVFESKYHEGLTKEEGVNLVCEAICSGIFNDLGSGSNVDVCVITKGQKEYLRNHLLPNPRTYVSSKVFSFPRKTVFN
ncbi:Proteasome subunit beta type-7-B [Morella rubra]|uniref:proteasome endopeptidase complex n=1 Tax=Morella rubra TaxID=262757 RepID=A0A6A1VQV5_9ROSI|nr:Proteasome subunit beta type-7-B [Morella rubra]